MLPGFGCLPDLALIFEGLIVPNPIDRAVFNVANSKSLNPFGSNELCEARDESFTDGLELLSKLCAA